MRMAGPDVVLFVVGALLFGGATYAIISSGGLGATSASGVFDVTYSARDLEPLASDAGSMRTATADFEVNATNVGKVLITVACADQAGAVAPFNLQITVEGPGGLTGEGSGACGTDALVEIDVSPQPPQLSVPGSTEDEARGNLPALDNATKAVGAWTVTVSGGRNAGPTGLPGVPGVPDPSGTITLTASVWEPRLTPVEL